MTASSQAIQQSPGIPVVLPQTPDELMATCWSSAGDAASDRTDLRSPLNLRERIEAAASAGFSGFGLLSADLPAAVAEYGLPGIRAILADNGITRLELEDIPNWWDDGPRKAESDRIRNGLLEAAEALGARHLKVTPDGTDAPFDAAHWAEKFAELANQAQGVGARLGIEFFPWSNIKTLHDGLKLVEDAGHDAGGVVIDTWHVARANTPIADLAAVPLHRIIGVELDDADEQVIGTLFEDTVHRRRYCGDGAFDLPGMINALRTAGWNGPWGVEILSMEHRSLPVDEALRRAAVSARSVLDRARKDLDQSLSVPGKQLILRDCCLGPRKNVHLWSPVIHCWPTQFTSDRHCYLVRGTPLWNGRPQ